MRSVLCILTLCFSVFIFSQNKKLDSLLLEEKKPSHDSIKALVYFNIGVAYSKSGEVEKSDNYFAKARAMSFVNYKNIYAKTLRYVASSLKRQTKYQQAIDTLRKAIKYDQENGLEKELSFAYGDVGVIYRMTGNFKFSIENLLRSIPLREKFGNKADIMNGYNSLANSYSALAERTKNVQDFEKAIEYYKKAESYTDNKPALTAMILSNLGVTNGYIGKIKRDSNLLNLSRSYHLKSYEIQQTLKDSAAIIYVLGNIGVINYDLGNQYNSLKYLRSAENYFLKAIQMEKDLKMDDQYSNKANLAGAYVSIGKIDHSKETLLKGIRLGEEVLEKAKKANDYIFQANMLEGLMNGYDLIGDPKMALLYSKKYISIKDTMLNSENNNTIRELSTKFETDKKEKENQILKQQGELNATQLKQQKILSYSLIFGAFFLIIFVGMVYRNLNASKKSNKIISLQKLEVEKQKHLVEEKQKEVMDSIRYAKRIQQAALPSEKYIERNLPKS